MNQTSRFFLRSGIFLRSHIGCLLLLAGSIGAPLKADTLNYTDATDVTLHTGEDLLFRVSIADYLNEAPYFGAPLLPTNFSFTLVTAPTSSGAQFQTGLESYSGDSTDILPGSLTFQPGTFDSSTYDGPVSTLNGSFSLSPQQSASLFADGTAFLLVEDVSGEATIGLPSYTLPNDLYGSVSGGDLSVGAWTISTFYDPPPPSVVPEPGSGSLMLIGCLGLAITATFRGKARRWFQSVVRQ
jgi:hypothetical protein